MSTDKELLERAAKAAGRNVRWHDGKMHHVSGTGDWPGIVWDPLNDDGDALRLAVKLKLAIRPLDKCVFVESDPETLLGQSSVSELEMYGRDGDVCAVTRRAIVRAAAAMSEEKSQ